MIDAIRLAALGMRSNPIRNYIAPGLTSWLIGAEGHGKIRLFTADRDTREWITPHSHRFGFTCLVLAGRVENILFERAPEGNAFAAGTLRLVDDGMGKYAFAPADAPSYWAEKPALYTEGDTYSMKSQQVHSIRFGKGSVVLFLEGREVCSETTILEPWSDGKRVPTFTTAPWMFQREEPA